MLRFIYFALFLLWPLIHIVVVEEIRGLMLRCGVPHTGFLFKRTLSALFGPSHTGKHPGNNNDTIFLFLSREYICLVVLIHSEYKAWKCFHSFICNNKLVSQLLEVSCILKGNVVVITTVLQWVKDRGCFFLASPPCAGMSAGAYWTVAAAFWPTSWPPILQRLPFYSTTSVVFLHKCERRCACCTFNYSLGWIGLKWSPLDRKLTSSCIPTALHFYLNLHRVDTTGA